MRLTRLAVLIWITAVISFSQTPQPASVPGADPVIRVSVNLVQIDAVVTDSKGRHVSGLASEDFEVFEDGKPQKITHLSYLDATPATEPQTAPSKSASANGRNSAELVSAPSRQPRREEIRRAMVFMVDDIHTSPDDLARLKPVAKKFVTEQVAPGDLVSISVVSGGMGFYEQFTSDRNILSGAVESLAKRPGGNSNPLAGVTKLPVPAADCGYRAARSPTYHREVVPGCGRRVGADPNAARAFISPDDRTLSRDEAGFGPRAERRNQIEACGVRNT